METLSASLLKKYNSIFEERECSAIEDDYKRFEKNSQLLLKLAKVENSSLTVYDMSKKSYTLMCNKFNCWSDFSLKTNELGPRHLIQMMHPDDLTFVMDSFVKYFDFIDKQLSVNKTDFKLIFDFRLQNSKGFYTRFIQQTIILELDSLGNIWLVLTLFDLEPNIEINEPLQRKVINMKNSELSLFLDELDFNSKTLLTVREKEVLNLMYQGFESQDIANKLFISLNTVNNHRQHILAKTKTKNTAQALLYAKKLGLI